MSKSAVGSVVDLENGSGLAGLNIDIEDVSQVHDNQFLNDPLVTDSSGQFNVSYKAYAYNTAKPGAQARQLKLTIRIGRQVLKEIFQNEGAFGDTVDFGQITLHRAAATSWRATLGDNNESRVSGGNSIRWLADNVDAWKYAANVMKNSSNLDIMQLQIDVGKYTKDNTKDNPIVVLDFSSNDTINQNNQNEFIISQDDDRIEKCLLSAATRKAAIRVQIPRMSLDSKLLETASVVLTAGSLPLLGLGLVAIFLVGGIIFFVIGLILLAAGSTLAIADYILPALPKEFEDWYSGFSKEPALKQWFDDAATDGQDVAMVEVRELIERSFNVTHAKIVMDSVSATDTVKKQGKEAVLLGSPFEQVYFDSFQHDLDAGWRGNSASKGPIHDVNVAVRGPVLNDIQDLFDLHWKFTTPSENSPDHQPPAPATIVDGEFATDMQLVLTLDKMFSELGETDGEKGVLEAYLRAIHFAQRFIYIENQYFYHSTITQALQDALASNPQLAVILVLNVSPDTPLYLHRQNQAIKRISTTVKNTYPNDDVKKHFRVFSVFAHSPSDALHSKPRLVDVYLHTKTAIIDNVWATVGSANLDGLSLDTFDFSKYAVDGEVRQTEANIVIHEDPPATPSAVDALRRRLWAEHLGILDNSQAGALDVNSADLEDSPNTDWLTFWSQKADAKLASLKDDPNKVSPIHILPIDFDYGPDTKAENFISKFLDNTKGALKDHYALESYLQHLFAQDPSTQRKAGDFDFTPPRNLTFSTAK